MPLQLRDRRRQIMSGERSKEEKRTVDDLEPICLFITRTTIEGPNEEDVNKAVNALLSDFKILRTPNPFVWFFLGRWRPEISENGDSRITKLQDSLKLVEGNAFVTVSYLLTNYYLSQQLAWKAWRDIIS
jgi:hypothetical protein